MRNSRSRKGTSVGVAWHPPGRWATAAEQAGDGRITRPQKPSKGDLSRTAGARHRPRSTAQVQVLLLFQKPVREGRERGWGSTGAEHAGRGEGVSGKRAVEGLSPRAQKGDPEDSWGRYALAGQESIFSLREKAVWDTQGCSELVRREADGVRNKKK